ncbi:RNA-directed DNA polymerase, eukaryota, partial [Tanacetum coccineum]
MNRIGAHEIYLLHALFTGEYLFSFAHLMIDDIWSMYENEHRRIIPPGYYISEILDRLGAVSRYEHVEVVPPQYRIISRESIPELKFSESPMEYVEAYFCRVDLDDSCEPRVVIPSLEWCCQSKENPLEGVPRLKPQEPRSDGQAHHTTYVDMSPQYSIVDQWSMMLYLSCANQCHTKRLRTGLLTWASYRGFNLPFGAMHSGSSLLTGGQQRGIISPFGAMLAGSSFDPGGQQRGNSIISPFGAMHAGSSLLTDGQQRAGSSTLLPVRQQRDGSYLLTVHAASSLLTGGQQRGIISPFGAMHAGHPLLTLVSNEVYNLAFGAMHVAHLFLTVVSKEVKFRLSGAMHSWLQRGIISPFGAMHAGSSLLTDGQQRGIISPFGAMHAGSSLLTDGQQRGIISPFDAISGSSLLTGGQQRGIISPFGAMHAGSSLLTGGQQRGIISPFGAMHAGSSLLTGGQQRGIISPFGAMHAGSSLLTGGQQRGIISLFRCMHAGYLFCRWSAKRYYFVLFGLLCTMASSLLNDGRKEVLRVTFLKKVKPGVAPLPPFEKKPPQMRVPDPYMDMTKLQNSIISHFQKQHIELKTIVTNIEKHIERRGQEIEKQAEEREKSIVNNIQKLIERQAFEAECREQETERRTERREQEMERRAESREQEIERRAELQDQAIIWDIERQHYFHEQEQAQLRISWNQGNSVNGLDEFQFPQMSRTSFHPPRVGSKYYDPTQGDEIPKEFEPPFHDIYGPRREYKLYSGVASISCVLLLQNTTLQFARLSKEDGQRMAFDSHCDIGDNVFTGRSCSEIYDVNHALRTSPDAPSGIRVLSHIEEIAKRLIQSPPPPGSEIKNSSSSYQSHERSYERRFRGLEGSWFSANLRQASFDIIPVWIAIVLVYWIRAKEVPGWTPDLVEDSDEEELSDDDSLEEGMKNLESENDCSNSFEVPDTVFENEGGSKKDSSVDPFGLYPLLNKKTKDQKHKESGTNSSPKFSPGFTPNNDNDDTGDKKSVNDFEEEKLNEDDGDSNNSNLKENVDESASFGHFKKSVAPSLAQKAKKDWAKELCVKNKVNFLAIQETKMEEIDLFSVRRGVWLLNGIDLMIIAVYAPHDPRDKRMLWDYLAHVINQWQGEVVIMGDFNEVRVKSDRFGTNFNVLGANIFNSFINSTGLEEVHLGG